MTIEERLRSQAKRLLPAGSRRGQWARRALGRSPATIVTTEAAYRRWIETVEQRQKHPLPDSGPLISIVVPAFNTLDRYLGPLLNSIGAQTYSRWQLVLVNASTDPERQTAIKAAAKRDRRIKVVSIDTNDGIAANTNAGLAQADGDFIAFCDHDDTLAPFALAEAAAALNEDPTIDLIYSDEDKLSEDGAERLLAFFKPDWSPELMGAANYLSHLIVARASLIKKVGGLRAGFEGAQDFDFNLRLIDGGAKVRHIAAVLYHWRIIPGSTATRPEEKPDAGAAGRRALEEQIARLNLPATAEGPDAASYYRIRYHLPTPPPVKVLASPAAAPGWFDQLKAETDYPGLEQIETANLSDMAPSELVLFIDPTLRPGTRDWLRQLASLAVQEGMGAVGAEVRIGAKRAEAGYVLDRGVFRPLFRNYAAFSWTEFGNNCWPRDLIIPAPYALVIKRSLLPGGLSSGPAAALAAFRKGQRNVFWPHAWLTTDQLPEMRELPAPTDLEHDPYFNPQLAIIDDKITLRT